MKDVLVPDIGDFKNVEVIEILVKPGDTVAKEQSLVTLESDKATMEIPSPGAGLAKRGRITVGESVCQRPPTLVRRPSKAAQPAAAAAAAPKPAPSTAPTPAPAV